MEVKAEGGKDTKEILKIVLKEEEEDREKMKVKEENRGRKRH